MTVHIRAIAAALALVFAATASASAQTPGPAPEPVSDGRPLSEWIAELRAPSPQTRNAAAYEIARIGPAAAAAVPALIEALHDTEASVRYPVTVALREIGPAAKDAVPALKEVYEGDINDEVASSARRAIKAISPGDVPRD